MSNKRKQKYEGLRYVCPKCDALYSYEKKCPACGMKTVEVQGK